MMLSRIAENMFWMNRYMERVDAMSRSMRYFFILGFDIWEGDNLGYRPLLQCFGMHDKLHDEEFVRNATSVLKHLATDTTNLNSMRVLLGKARENARGSQDKITKEVWEQINMMYHAINEDDIDERLDSENALILLDTLEKHSLMYAGILESTMPRGLGWEFMNVGKYLDRALHTIDMFDAYMNPISYNMTSHDEMLYWRRLLYALSGYELYLKNNRGGQHTCQVMSQVIFNNDFPRSLTYTLNHGKKYLDAILASLPDIQALRLEKKFGRIKSNVEFTDQTSLTGDDLKLLLSDTRRQLWEFSVDFSKHYFSYS